MEKERLQKETEVEVVYSMDSYKEFGCIKCGCDTAKLQDVYIQGEYLPGKCSECGEYFVILAGKCLEIAKKGNVIAGGFDRVILAEHPRKGIKKHEYQVKDLRPELGEYYTPRGIGSFYSYGFVKSIAAAERIIEMFDEFKGEIEDKEKLNSVFSSCSAWIPKKQGDLNEVKLEFDFNIKAEPKLNALHEFIRENNYVIDKVILKKVLDMKLTLPNIWKYKALYETSGIFDEYSIKKYFEIFLERKQSYSYLEKQKVFENNMQYHIMAFVTFSEVSIKLEEYEIYIQMGENANRYLKQKCEENIRNLLKNFEMFIDFNHLKIDKKTGVKVENAKNLLKELLAADME